MVAEPIYPNYIQKKKHLVVLFLRIYVVTVVSRDWNLLYK